MGGGYFPVGAAAITAKIADTIAQHSGTFGAGYTWAGNPLAAAVVSKSIDYLKAHQLVEQCAEMGVYLAEKLVGLRSHPTVGDIRGTGLMQGIEFVQSTITKQPLAPQQTFWRQLADEALARGLFIESSGG